MVSHSESDPGGISAGSSSGMMRGGGALVPTGDGSRWAADTAARPEILSVSPRPIDLVYALRRRWAWAVGLGVLSAALAVGVAWLWIPVNYSATAWLRIASAKPQIMFKTSGGNEFLNHRRAQATLMTSNFVLNAAMRKPGVAQLPDLRDERDPVTWIRKNITVSFPGNSEILQIAMAGEDPSQLKTVVNAVKDAYMEEVVAVDREGHLRRKKVLEQSYQRNMEQIKKKSYTFQQLAEQLGTADSETARVKQFHELEGRTELRSKVNNLRHSISGMERRIAILRSRLGQTADGEEPLEEDEEALVDRLTEMAVLQDPWIARTRSQIMALETAKFEESLRSRLGKDAPSVFRLQARMESLMEGIAKRRQELLPQMKEYVQKQVDEGVALAPPTEKDRIRTLIEDTDLEKGVLESELETAMADFTESAKESEKLGAYSSELETRKTELERLKKITDRMGVELEHWEVELAASPRVTLLEAAHVPSTNDINAKYRKVVFVGLAAFGLAVLGVAAVDFVSRRVNSPAEVAYGLGVQVMGDLPMITGRGRRDRKRVNGAASGPLHGMLIESIDNIRTALLHRAESETLRVILVTSALEKEGKTTLASQLAASLARSGRRTLLVDGDLRRPSQHRLFDLPLQPGLSELLRKDADLEDVIRPTRVAGLWLAPAGACDLDAVQALAKGGLRTAFERLRNEFDFILLDSGPVLTHADALLFGQYADAVLLSVLRDISRVPRVFEACERIRAVDLRLMGAVVNGTSFTKYRSYYHYRPYSIEVEPASV